MGCNTGRDCVDAHAKIVELEAEVAECNAVAAELATKYDRHVRELEAENAKLEDDLEWREKMLQSLHDQGYIVYVTGASVMPPRPDCESTFVMGSVSRFTTEGSDG